MVRRSLVVAGAGGLVGGPNVACDMTAIGAFCNGIPPDRRSIVLRIHQQTNASVAKSYYASAAEYYRAGEQEIVGQWGGKAAQRLDLDGDILRNHFERLCDNLHPFTAEQLTARMRKDRRVGYDFTFDACKSVSILYGITGADEILEAFRRSVAETMREMEAGVKARIRKHGQYAERTVGNMAWGEFLHFTARPVKGEIDPHVHAHLFVPNLCFDPVERSWKAIDVASIKQGAARWQAAFQIRFGCRLAGLGYAIAWNGDNFEIAGIGRELIERFSRRTDQIHQAAEQRGLTDPRDLDKLGALTRERKQNDATLPELRERWLERMTDGERDTLARIAGKRYGVPRDGAEITARLRARDRAATPELDAWERGHRDFYRREAIREGRNPPERMQ